MPEITIANRANERTRAAGVLDQFAAERLIAPETVAQVQIALDEILVNIADYAYDDDAEHQIHIRFEMIGGCLAAVIEDDGARFNPLETPAPDLGAPLRERRVGGLGIHFVRQLMDEVIYERVGERNRLVIRKFLKA